MKLLALIPSRAWEYLLIVSACALIVIGFVRHERELGAAHEKTAVHAVAAAAAASAASETERRQARFQEIAHATELSASAVVADAAAARAQRDAAVVQLHAYVRRSAVPGNPASAASGPTADDGLLAGLLEASWQRNLSLAAEADARGVAGIACERAFDALSTGAPKPPEIR